MFGSTMLVTVGQALDRAQNEGTRIRLHVAGEWVVGTVMNTDSQAAMIATETGEVCVVRMDAISCVWLPADDAAPSVPAQRPPGADATY